MSICAADHVKNISLDSLPSALTLYFLPVIIRVIIKNYSGPLVCSTRRLTSGQCADILFNCVLKSRNKRFLSYLAAEFSLSTRSGSMIPSEREEQSETSYDWKVPLTFGNRPFILRTWSSLSEPLPGMAGWFCPLSADKPYPKIPERRLC